MFLGHSGVEPMMLLLARDVSHRDYIRMLQAHNKAK
jgi:hypothetical protein